MQRDAMGRSVPASIPPKSSLASTILVPFPRAVRCPGCTVLRQARDGSERRRASQTAFTPVWKLRRVRAAGLASKHLSSRLRATACASYDSYGR